MHIIYHMYRENNKISLCLAMFNLGLQPRPLSTVCAIIIFALFHLQIASTSINNALALAVNKSAIKLPPRSSWQLFLLESIGECNSQLSINKDIRV